jgi:hypothetical protein
MAVRNRVTNASFRLLSRIRNGPPVTGSRRRRNVKPVLPEDKLFYSVFHDVLIYKVISGLGKLALIWATVVLLGGFVTLIKPLDLWIVASIVFIEAARYFFHSNYYFATSDFQPLSSLTESSFFLVQKLPSHLVEKRELCEVCQFLEGKSLEVMELIIDAI